MNASADRHSFEIIFSTNVSPSRFRSRALPLTFPVRSIDDPHKITFLHPAGIVSYAILRPPSEKVVSEVNQEEKLPVFLSFHGAGLEADSHEVRHMLDSVPDLHAWTLFPTGGTSWSADDWRNALHQDPHLDFR